MVVPCSTYIIELQRLKQDLYTVMQGWPAQTLGSARQHADQVMPLIESEIQRLEKAAFQPQPANAVRLRTEVKELAVVMSSLDDQERFYAYDAMLEDLILNGPQ